MATTTNMEPAATTRVAGLDGVRGVAAVMIVVHHASSTADLGSRLPLLTKPASVMDGAVVVFFVLSGFVLHRPIAAAHLQGTPAPPLGPYLLRRAVRVLPAYWLALTVLWMLGAVTMGSTWWRSYLLLQPYDRFTTFEGIVQAWTLGVEVVFYLALPVWAAGIRRIARGRDRRRVELVGCAVLVGAAYGFRQVVSLADPSWRGLAFQWFPSYIDAFAIGMALAVLHVSESMGRERPSSRLWAVLRRPGVCWAAAGVLFGWYAWRVGGPTLSMLTDPNGAYRGGFWQRRQLVLTIVSTLLLAPLVLGAGRRSRVMDVMSSRPMVLLGAVSYGLYLWHFGWIDLVLEHLDYRSGSASLLGYSIGPGTVGAFVTGLAAGMVLGLGCALVSWYAVERPLLRRVRSRAGGNRAGALVAVLLLLVFVGRSDLDGGGTMADQGSSSPRGSWTTL